jgi:hypothetical protein
VTVIVFLNQDVHPGMQPARSLPASAPLRRDIAHVRSDLRPSRTRPWPRTCAAAWPEPWKALAHRARSSPSKRRAPRWPRCSAAVEVHLHAAVLVGVASAAQVVAGVVILRLRAAGLGRDPKPRAPTRYVGGRAGGAGRSTPRTAADAARLPWRSGPGAVATCGGA